jgi:hypothetical protein
MQYKHKDPPPRRIKNTSIKILPKENKVSLTKVSPLQRDSKKQYKNPPIKAGEKLQYRYIQSSYIRNKTYKRVIQHAPLKVNM